VLRDVLGTVVQNERGFSVEPYPNRSASLQWLLRNRSAAIQHARLSIYTLDGSATELPRYAIPTDTVDDVLRTLRQPVLAVEVPAIELDPHPEPQFVSFPKAEGETVPLSMQGGLLVALTDDAT